ncbi:aldehyde dehydrogenase family protein [Sphingomonas sp. C3-2]|uniref:aldehyde dehydrogenase family protein n=1 Tax=Sphingomonas sp. C3-2 TaxID=3062169 RepID=UPI00294B8D3D|nr:aldehyde dehydrogenase family protein [Sphingomonas sp. C3-2]WOK37209.1 aldehyde dehydrogenase family protein [Sphingomonas sp. C3-2]
MKRGTNFIAGQWRDGADRFETRSPADRNDVVGEYVNASRADAEEAVAAARKAFGDWAGGNIQKRSDIIRRAGDALLARSTEIGTLLAREEGKLLSEGIGEAVRAAQSFHYYAGEVLRHPGQWLPSVRDGMDVTVSYEPVGVVSLITPWNFPIAIPAWKTAAALAYGNTVVLKVSEAVPGCGVLLAEILAEAGVPEGVFNLIVGDGRVMAEPLVKDVDALSFTGSTTVGQILLQQAAPYMTKVQLELGGKNPLVVLDDADLDLAIDVALQGAFAQTGQRCTASSRLIVAEGIHDAFVEGLAAKVRALRVGHSLDPQSQMGPVATAAQLTRNQGFVQSAKAEGAEALTGQDATDWAHEGNYMAPVLFAGTHNAMHINREEVFGPVASVIRVADLDEAIAVASDCELALSSGICTQNLGSAERFRRASPAGMVMINAPTAGVDYHAPFGGRRPSGYGGREQGTGAAEFFTEMKTTYLNHGVIGLGR